MTAEAFVIKELTGSQRKIVLRDRALPYRPVAWPGELAHKQVWYPGNPVATIQVLGPRTQNTEINGAWKTRYIGQMVELSGFDDIYSLGDDVTAEILVAAFHRVNRGGNMIEVRWGQEVRRGIMANFEPNYMRTEDVEWRVTFVWTQVGEARAPRVAQREDNQNNIDVALSDLDDVWSRIPDFILPNMTAAIIAMQNTISGLMISMSSNITGIYGIPNITLEQFRGIASDAEAINDACSDMQQTAIDGSIEEFIATSNVPRVLGAETWRRDLGMAAAACAVAAIEAREDIRSRVVDDYIDIVTMKENQTLRTLAYKYYGNADSWIVIADANGLTTSDVAVGYVVLIPRYTDYGVSAQ